MIRATEDAYLGPDGDWDAWHRAMLEERARLGHDYADPETDWSDGTFRQVFLFMYDASFFADGRYRTEELVRRWRTMFGRVDSVLLWHAYPRLGFDRRGQFDFYRDMPGGLSGLRAGVCDVFRAHGIRVFVDYNPWAEGSLDELGAIVAALGADGVMLDTMADAPDALARSVLARRRGVVFAPELRMTPADLPRHRQSWSQWADLGEGPSIHKLRWLAPRHRQLTIRRWDRSRRRDVITSFCDGTGLLLWDNVFGVWNPYTRADRRLVAETAAVIDRYGEVMTRGEWLPLVPTGHPGLDANRFTLGDVTLVTLHNRTDAPIVHDPREDGFRAFWGDREGPVVIAPDGVQAIVRAPDADDALAHFDELSRRADVDLPGYDEPTPRPRLVALPQALGDPGPSFVRFAGGDVTLHVRHARRESGCYPLGASDDAMGGWFYKDTIEHVIAARVTPFAIRRTPVTNAEFVAFVRTSGYAPRDPDRFLAHLPGLAVPDDLADRPVTFVSLEDARAYAAFHGERLPTEAEWQVASASLEGASGGPWELTESEHDDGHTRFVLLRGGAPLPPGESEWLPARGPQPSDTHVKYILLGAGIDRSEAIAFRTAQDVLASSAR